MLQKRESSLQRFPSNHLYQIQVCCDQHKTFHCTMLYEGRDLHVNLSRDFKIIVLILVLNEVM